MVACSSQMRLCRSLMYISSADLADLLLIHTPSSPQLAPACTILLATSLSRHSSTHRYYLYYIIYIFCLYLYICTWQLPFYKLEASVMPIPPKGRLLITIVYATRMYTNKSSVPCGRRREPGGETHRVNDPSVCCAQLQYCSHWLSFSLFSA